LKPVYVTPEGNVSVTKTPVALLGPAFDTAIVYVSIPPAVTGLGKAVFIIERLAEAVTVVDIVVALLELTGSSSVAVTLAALLRLQPEDGGLTVIIMAGAVPTDRLGVVQVTKYPLIMQFHPEPFAFILLTPPGRLSVTVTSVAGLGPRFVTVIV
jgi:hypothetical protein